MGNRLGLLFGDDGDSTQGIDSGTGPCPCESIKGANYNTDQNYSANQNYTANQSTGGDQGGGGGNGWLGTPNYGGQEGSVGGGGGGGGGMTYAQYSQESQMLSMDQQATAQAWGGSV